MIDRKLRNTSLLVATCFFMENLDGTIVTTAMPQIGESLNASPASVSLVITAYLLTLAVLIPLSGWLTQRFGSRPIFLSAMPYLPLHRSAVAFRRVSRCSSACVYCRVSVAR